LNWESGGCETGAFKRKVGFFLSAMNFEEEDFLDPDEL